ncbi:hypothetical protein KCU91_g16467, partial [Aureobasidium melanogenum]
MAPKKTIERTAASTRPKRTPKPTTVATSSAPAPKPKKKTAASKKTATKTAAPKKTAANKITKETAPKKTTFKKAASKKAGAAAKGGQKESAAKYQKRIVPLYENPLGVEGQKRIAERKKKEAEEDNKWKRSAIDVRYTLLPVIDRLKKDYKEGVAKGEWAKMGFEKFLKIHKDFDAQAWDKAHKRKIGSLESEYTSSEAKNMIKDMRQKQDRNQIPHILDFTDYLYWKEIDKERAKIIAAYKADYKKEQQQKKKKQGNVSAVSSPVKKAQNTVVNASPVKKAQDALTRSRSKSPTKKMLSNDSGYQTDNEQQSVMSRTWELAANAVEAMRSAVNPE